MSGQSNVLHWLEAHDVQPLPVIIEAIFEAGKQASAVLADVEIWRIVTAHQGTQAVSISGDARRHTSGANPWE